MATVTGQRASSPLPTPDTPSSAGAFPARSHADELAQSARSAWRSVTPSFAGTPHVRISRDGGRRYPAKHARPLPAEPPNQPATIPVFDPGSATGRMLVLDLDPGRAVKAGCLRAIPRGEELTAHLDGQAAELGQLLERLGARHLTDVAPSGGRHVYVLLSSPLPWRELRDLARAIALRFPVVDVAPMSSLGGQISPPGSRHKSGGWRLLTMPLEATRIAVERPNGPEVWNALLTEFAAELQAAEFRTAVLDPEGGIRESPHGSEAELQEAEIRTASADLDLDTGSNRVSADPDTDSTRISAELDDTGVPWLPRRGGRASLGAELDRAARTGRSPGRGRSEARMAILASAAARGWRLADVLDAVSSGTWKGFPDLYYRATEPGRMDRLLPAEWRKAIAFVGGSENPRNWLTSDVNHAPRIEPGDAAEFGFIRQWATGTACAAADPERVRGWGRRSVAIRQLLAAIGQAAMVSGSCVLEFGTRNLALHSGLSQRTVSRLLRFLYSEPDPLLDLVNIGRMARADRFALRIPDRYADSVRWRRRRAGRLDGVHPAFLVLGGTAFLVHQVLDADPVRGAEVARAALLSSSATLAALRVLAEHGLADRGRDGWRRGPANLDEVATATGAADLQRERAERYKQDRIGWRARVAQYLAAGRRPVNERDGWLSLDDDDEWESMLFGRWPALGDDFVRGPPVGEADGTTGAA